MEFDLARLRVVDTAEEFLVTLDEICSATITSDFWSISLPNDLATSAARSPSMFAFYAALNVLDARALYSEHTVRELMDPTTRAPRDALERHHLFPVAYLKKHGVTDQREYNQIANFTILEWGDNAVISDAAPDAYVPKLEARFDKADLQEMYSHHALPYGWEQMQYEDFLRERRTRIAQTIRAAYEQLAGHAQTVVSAPSVVELVAGGEGAVAEFKATLRTNLHTGEKDAKMEQAVLKTIAGFLNKEGGTLVIGVADDGSPVGVGADGFPSEDRMALHLVNLLKDRLGGQNGLYIHPRFEDYGSARALVISCDPAKSPVFVKDGPGTERFFVRYGPSTQELTGGQAQDYIKQRFVGAA